MEPSLSFLTQRSSLLSLDFVQSPMKKGLWGEGFKRDRDAAIISYWWD
jgi:hypothetical protein